MTVKYPLICTSDTWEGVWRAAAAAARQKGEATTLTLLYPPRMNVMADGRPPCIIAQFSLEVVEERGPEERGPLRPEERGRLNGLTAAEEEVKFAAVANCNHSAQDWRSEFGKIFCDECHPRGKP